MKIQLAPVCLVAGVLTAFTACDDDGAAGILTSQRALECGIDGAVETVDQCLCLGATVRPSPAGPVECEADEVEVGEVPFDIEGAVCCAKP